MGRPLRVLIVEDDEVDAELIQVNLLSAGFAVTSLVIDTPVAMRAALDNQKWDIITSDHSMPRFSAPAALALAQECCPDVPFIIVSGEIDINLAVSLMRGGAKDYIQKREIKLLVPAIERELREVELRRERQKVDTALIESEAHYNLLFETMDSGFSIQEIICDEQGIPCDYRFLEINPAYEELTHIKAEAAIGHTVLEILPGADMEEIKRYGKVALTGEPDHFELYVSELGKYLEINAFSPRHGQFAIMFQDITARKQAEEALRNSEAFLNSIIENTSYAMWISDDKGMLIKINQVCRNLFHINDNDAVRWYNVLEDTNIEAQGFLPLVKRVFAEGKTARFTLRYDNPLLQTRELVENGRMFLEVTISPVLDAKGKVTNAIIQHVDITERNHAEDLLRQSEEKYRLLVENMGEGLCLVNPEDRFTYANSAAENLFGAMPGGLSGRSIFEFIIPDQFDMIHEQNRRRKDGERTVYEWEIKCRDGERRSLLVTAVPRFDSHQGQFEGTFGVFRDITEEKRTEVALAEERNLLVSIMDNIPDSIYFKDLQSRFIRANQAVARRFGLNDPALLVGKTDFDLFDEEHARVAYEDEQAIIRSSQPLVAVEEKETFPDGHVAWVSTTKMPRWNQQGQIVGTFGISRDISKHKLAEDTLVNQTRIASIFSIFPDEEMFNEVLKVVLDVMHSPFGIFGYIDENGDWVAPTLTQQVWDQCNIRDKRIRYPQETWGDSSYVRALREKRTICSNAPSTNIPEGHIGIQRHISFPILFQNEAIGLFQVANKETDYTEEDIRRLSDVAGTIAPLLMARLQRDRSDKKLRASEEKYRKLYAELEQRVVERTTQLNTANQELEAFSYSVSHDLRAPLRHLDGFTSILLENYAIQLDENGKRYLAIIQEASHRMERLINDLLNLSLVTRADFTRRQVDLSLLANSIAAELKAQSHHRVVTLDIAPNMIVAGDENLLKIALENLLNNAFKFTSHCQVATIQVGVIKQDGEQVYFVRDNGAGFNMDNVKKLFVAFQRLHSEKEFTGTGIGLATVQRIIHRHGGRIWAEGSVDQGATFYFTIA